MLLVKDRKTWNIDRIFKNKRKQKQTAQNYMTVEKVKEEEEEEGKQKVHSN